MAEASPEVLSDCQNKWEAEFQSLTKIKEVKLDRKGKERLCISGKLDSEWAWKSVQLSRLYLYNLFKNMPENRPKAVIPVWKKHLQILKVDIKILRLPVKKKKKNTAINIAYPALTVKDKQTAKLLLQLIIWIFSDNILIWKQFEIVFTAASLSAQDLGFDKLYSSSIFWLKHFCTH